MIVKFSSYVIIFHMAEKINLKSEEYSHKKSSKKKSSAIAELRDEIEDLHLAIETLHRDLKRMSPPNPWKRAGRSFAGGIVKGLGFIFGTTIIAAIMIWGIQKAISSPIAENWLTDKISSIITDAVQNTVSNVDLPSF